MFIVLELEKLPDLCERIHRLLDPDIPLDMSHPESRTLKTMSDLIMVLLGYSVKTTGSLDEVLADEELIESTKELLTRHVVDILAGLMVKSIDIINRHGDILFHTDE